VSLFYSSGGEIEFVILIIPLFVFGIFVVVSCGSWLCLLLDKVFSDRT